MSTSNEYCITAGAFAKLCNTTRDTLRYYEKEGILIPHRKESNNYGYYSYAQITSYYFIATFRSLGCPVSEIRAFLEAESPEAFDPFINKQYDALLQMQQVLEHNIASLSISLLFIDKMRSCPDAEPHLSTLPSSLRFRNTKITQDAYHAEDLLPDLKRHIMRCQNDYDTYTFPIGVAISLKDFYQGGYRYDHLVSFTKSKGNDTTALPYEQILCCVYRSQTEDITLLYEKMNAYANKNALTMCSDVYSISLINAVYPDDAHLYLKFIFVCVK